jgi:hypothetical protein
MAITRAQQFRQMLKEGTKKPVVQGGVDNYLGDQPQVVVPRNWQSGPDKPPTELAYITEAEKKLLLKEDIHGSLKKGPNKGPGGVMSLDSFGDIGGGGQSGADFDADPGGAGSFSGRGPNESRDDFEDRKDQQRQNLEKIKEQQEQKAKEMRKNTLNLAEKFRVNRLKKLYENKFLPGQNKFAPIAAQVFQSLTPTQLSVYEESDPMFDAAYYGMTGEDITDTDRLAKAINQAEKTGNISQSEFEDAFFGPGGRPDLSRDDDGPDPILPIIPTTQDPTTPTTPVRNLAGLDPRIGGSIFNFDEFAADGGRIGAAEGGIMDLESGRQMYFLGKLVKKATRAVKKIAKSPVGKAALLYGLGAMGGSFGAGKGLFSAGMFNPANIKAGLFGQAMKPGFAGPGIPGLFNKLGLTKTAGSFMPTFKGGITLASILPLLAGKTDEEKKNILDEYYASQKLEPSQSVRGVGSEMDFYKYNLPVTAADGGRIGYQEGSKEPVAKKTMPLLDMGGKEMDLREDGGFVPIGRMEKADDVPARLSKNEFVFTADAVRNAGDGNVDKGAEVMYNMMKNLESGGDVSEESQGLSGAREMFQTSKRLEEVL